MAAKADILTLAKLIALTTEVNDTNLNDYFDEAVRALSDSQVFVGFKVVQAVNGTAKYAYPTNALRVLTVLWHDKELTETSTQQLDAVNRSWRATTGTPTCWMEEHVDERQVRIYPIPDTTGDAAADNWGATYPDNDLVFVTVDSATTIPDWIDIPVALGMLAREFSRESKHRDPRLAQLYVKLGLILRRLAGGP